MKAETLRWISIALSIALLLGAWALVIWMAVVVSQTVLNTLDSIVKLAQMG